MQFLLLSAIAGAELAAVPIANPLIAVADQFGARLGMARATMLSRAPGPCTVDQHSGPERLFADCGARALSAGFTASGRAWWVTASYDLTGTAYGSKAARAALEARFGKPTDLGEGTLVWLPAGSTANAGRCLIQATLLTAAVDLRATREGTAGLPEMEAGCLPLRSAILAERGNNRGVIVEVRDPRGRVAELTRQ